VIRFVHFFNYASGVSVVDGERWYLGAHTSQVKKLPGVQRYVSWRGLEVPSSVAPLMQGSPEQFIRRSELWLEDIAAWQEAYSANPTLWATSQKGVPGFREFECMFLDIEPEYDLLQKVPPQEYKYLTVPLKWAKGEPPEVEDRGDLVINNYFFFYRPDVSITDGEDWYFGHHTREGRRTPGVRHYKSWKTLRVPEDPNSTLRPNKWFRVTERGFGSIDAWYVLKCKETGITFTQSPLGNVWGGFASIFTRPALAEDLLA
jgi:hypothetical protein